MVNSKFNWQGTSVDKFKNLTVKEVLQWMEGASRFMQKHYTSSDLDKIRKTKERQWCNVRRIK